MARVPRIGDWPFPSQEEVLLLWLRSPHRSPRGRQWRLDACFRPVNGSPRELEMPWGALPQLALGLTYLDGYVVEEKPAWGTPIEFEVPRGVLPETRSARSVLPPDVLTGMVGEGGDEHCLVFDLPGQRIVLPVLEAIRTLLCPNRTLASGLLEPEYLPRIIASHEVKEKTLHLGFTAEIAPAALDQVVARRLGRLLYDDSFRRAWEAVERGRFHAAGPALPGRRVPLDCPLPDLDPRWVVRAMPVDVAGTWLVLEILSVGAANDLPFKRVVFTHPKLSRTQKTDAPAGTGAKGEGGGGPANASAGQPAGSGAQSVRRLSIERSDRAPRDSRRPRRAGTIVSGLVGDQWIEVHKLAARTRTRRREGQKGSPATTPTTTAPAAGPCPVVSEAVASKAGPPAPTATAKPAGKGDAEPREVPVSLSSAARDGATPAGEYKVVEPPPGPPPKSMELRPLPLVCKTHEGLDRLAVSLGHLAAMRPDWTIEWGLAALEVNIPYAQMGSQKRQYALVRCAGAASAPPPPTCWLLEFARLDQRAPSTLLFFPGRNDGADATPEGDEEVRRRVPRLVREILAATLKEKGWWDQPELMKFHHAGRMRFDLASHHFSRKSLDWAERLEKRIRQARQAVAKP